MKSVYKYQLAVLLVIMIPIAITAQTVKKSPSVLFIENVVDARSSAMGGMYDLSDSSVFNVFINPSAFQLVNSKAGVGVSLTGNYDFSHSNLYSFGSFFNIDDKNGIALGVRYFSYPDIPLMDVNGISDGSFSPGEITIDVGYGRKLTSNLSASVTARYVRSDMGSYSGAKAAIAFAADFGVTYKTDVGLMDGANIKAAMALNNFGTKIKYDEIRYDMPAAVKVGSSLFLPFADEHKLTLLVNAGYRVLPSYFNSFEAGVGSEYNVFRYLFVRCGYHFGDKSRGTGNYSTIGAGVAYRQFKLDISSLNGVAESKFRNTFLIGLSAFF